MSSQQATLSKTVAEALEPFSQIITDSVIRAQEEQSAIILKLQTLAQELDSIQKALPASDVDPITDSINSLCSRIENCHKRIQDVSKRAEWIIKRLDSRPPTTGKTANLIDVS